MAVKTTETTGIYRVETQVLRSGTADAHRIVVVTEIDPTTSRYCPKGAVEVRGKGRAWMDALRRYEEYEGTMGAVRRIYIRPINGGAVEILPFEIMAWKYERQQQAATA